MKDYYKGALVLHKKYGGKIGIQSKVPLRNRDELSLAYTPGVAAVSIEIGKDNKKAFDYTLKKNSVAIVSDGSAILGLGNLGPYAAIPVMEGKAAILKEFANIDAFPICLATQNTEEIITAVKQIAPVFGAINLEDISAPRCFEIESRLRRELSIPVMHDDQHGTATVVLAALINAIRLRKIGIEEARIVINGAGAAGSAIAYLLVKYGFKKIIVCDTEGAIYKGRLGLNIEKVILSKATNSSLVRGPLSQILLGAHIFIGVSKAGLLSKEMVRSMDKDPIIFALANPVPEIMPDLAKKAGAFIIATGRSDFDNQLNNSLGFPGLFRGALDNHLLQFNDQVFLRAAEAIAAFVKNPTPDKILPTQFDKGLVKAVAKMVY